MHQAGHEGTFFPAQLLDTGMTLVLAGLLALAERRRWAHGVSFAWAVVAYAGSRFIYEFWRAGPESPPGSGNFIVDAAGALPITRAQVMSLILVMIGLAFVYARWKRDDRSQFAAES